MSSSSSNFKSRGLFPRVRNERNTKNGTQKEKPKNEKQKTNKKRRRIEAY